MPTFLPHDTNKNPIPALRLRPDGAHMIAAGVASARNTAAFGADTRVVGVYATVPVYLRFGGLDVEAAATDHYFPAGVYYDIALGGGETLHYTNMAVLAVGSGGSVYVSEKE